MKHYFKDGITLTLQQQGTDALRIGIVVQNRKAFFNGKYTKKPKTKEAKAAWNDLLEEKISSLKLLKLMPRPNTDCGYHTFESGDYGFYYCSYPSDKDLKKVRVTLQEMVHVFDRSLSLCTQARGRIIYTRY